MTLPAAPPAEEPTDALDGAGVEISLECTPDTAHELAAEPGLKPAPQTSVAAAVDEAVAVCLKKQLP
jgi:hypothetical protein